MKFPIKAVLFDLDGVLVHSPLDLAAIKFELFGDTKTYIIEGIENLPEAERAEKNRILLEREMEAAAESVLAPNVRELFRWLESRGIQRGVITRNAREVVELISKKHSIDLGVIIARGDSRPKPDPDSVLTACRILGVNPEEAVMVGDFRFDIEAGKNSGAKTVFVETEKFKDLQCGEDARISNLSELKDIIEDWINAGITG